MNKLKMSLSILAIVFFIFGICGMILFFQTNILLQKTFAILGMIAGFGASTIFSKIVTSREGNGEKK